MIELARSIMSQRKSHPAREKGYIFYHGLRTAKIAMKLFDSLGRPDEVCPDILFCAAIFHDIGKGTAPHNETGASMVSELLKDHCKPEEISDITHIIRQHNKRLNSREDSTALRIHQDADILDHFGTQSQSVWLKFLWSSVHEETPEQALQFYNGQENQEWITGARSVLNFDISRQIFDKRLNFERRFFDLFAHENMDGL